MLDASPPYIELRSHTCFSFSDGAISAEALAKHARQLGYTHLGITDTADLGGLAKFAVEAMSPLKDQRARTPSSTPKSRVARASIPCGQSSARS